VAFTFRTCALATAVCAACLVASAVGYAHGVVNPDVPAAWLARDIAMAFGALAVAQLYPLGAVVAGGLLANAAAAELCGGVPDFIAVGGKLLSPGDVSIVGGFALLLLSLAYRYSKPVSEDSFASDC
jgi:peptidoglycan/LPS O-acetylase OafA/YrhL